MRIGVISDIHANRVALDAVLEAMPSVDRLVCAGDVIGYNPQPAECVEIVRDTMACVQGNHDRAVDAPERYRSNESAYEGLHHAAAQLDADQREWLRSLPPSRTLCEGHIRMVHSHPTHRGQYVRPEGFPALGPHLGEEDVLILGHTHIQHHEMVDGTLIMNPGSVGQPRDQDPRAAFSLLDPESQTVEEHRVSYDIERVQAAIESTGLPSWTGTRLERGR